MVNRGTANIRHQPLVAMSDWGLSDVIKRPKAGMNQIRARANIIIVLNARPQAWFRARLEEASRREEVGRLEETCRLEEVGRREEAIRLICSSPEP